VPEPTPENNHGGNASEFPGKLSFEPTIHFVHPTISTLLTELIDQIIKDKIIDEIEDLNSDFRWERMKDLNPVFKLLDAACQNVDRLRESNSTSAILYIIVASLLDKMACVKQFVTTRNSLITVHQLEDKIGTLNTMIQDEIETSGLGELRAPGVISLSAEAESS